MGQATKRRYSLALTIVATVVMLAAVASPTGAQTADPNHDPMPTWQTDGALINGKNLSGRVWHIEYGHGISDGMVFIAGRFEAVNAPASGEGGTVARSYVAAIDVDTGYLIERFAPVIGGDGDVEVRALELSGDGGTLYLGGWFTTVNSQPRRHLAAVDAVTGAVRGWNPDPSAKVSTLLATQDGSTLYAGGLFWTMGGTTRSYVASFDMTAGGALTDFSPAIAQPGPIQCGPRCWPVVLGLALSPAEDTVYVGGAFGLVDGQERNSVAAFDTATGTVLQWDPNVFHTRPDGTGSLNTIYELAATEDRVYLCGDYWAINTDGRNQYASPNVQAVDAVTGLADRDWVGSTDGAVNDCAIVGDTLVIGGHFDYAGGVKPADENGEQRQHIAAMDLATGDLTPWNPRANSAAGLYAVGRHVDDHLGVGGDFTTINFAPQEGFAQFRIGPPPYRPVLLDEDFGDGFGSWMKVRNVATDPTSGASSAPSAAVEVTAARGFAWFAMSTPRRDICVTAEVRPGAVGSARSTVVEFRAAKGGRIAELYRRADGTLWAYSAVSGELLLTTAVLEADQWHTVETCLTKGAGAHWEVAVDGIQVASWTPNVGNRKFGRIQIGDDAKRTWSGRFDDVVIQRR